MCFSLLLLFILDKTIVLLSSLFCGGDKPTTALEHTKRTLVIGGKKVCTRIINTYTVETVLQVCSQHFSRAQEVGG